MFVDRAVVSFLVTAWTNSILWSKNDEVFKEFSERNLSRVCQNIESAMKNGKNDNVVAVSVHVDFYLFRNGIIVLLLLLYVSLNYKNPGNSCQS